MGKMLYEIKWKGETPTLKQVRKKFKFKKSDVDKEFGVVLIDPEENLYSILVEEDAIVPENKTDDDEHLKGPFSNPKIEPFNLEE